MNKLKGSLAAKIIAIILLAMCCLMVCGVLVGITWLDSEGAYRDKTIETVREDLIKKRLQITCFDLLEQMKVMPVNSAYDSAVRFELLDENENILAGNLSEDDTVEHTHIVQIDGYYGGLYFTGENKPLTVQNSLPRDYALYSGSGVMPERITSPVPIPTVTPAPVNGTGEMAVPEGTGVRTMRLYWTEESESAETDTEVRIYEELYPLRYTLIVVGVVSFLLAILLFVFLMASAGHHDASGDVKADVVERIPFDLLLTISITGICAMIIIIGETFNSRQLVMSFVIAAMCLIIAGLLTLMCLMSAAVRLKLKTLLSGCLIWRVLRWGWKWLKNAFCALADLLHGIPLIWKWIPVYAVLLILDFWLTFTFRRDSDMLVFVLLLHWALIAAAILYVVLCLRRLRDGTTAIAAGEENIVIDTKHMAGDFKAQADDLMHIRDGLSRAVDERMKSERLRTELITNVSHDIKTPLTSIINYVDLLSHEELPEGNAAEYIAVLQRQSARLKKLTDDLVEASKASTGNLPVSLEQLDLSVLVDQIQGEYVDRLTEKKLELIVTKPDKPVLVQADPRHLWRVLDNLMTNILKYAMPGTRVYLDLTYNNSHPVLCLRNISAEPLNMRPEELTERFVRGDSSRSTDGSGLGLAIASSLCKLQNIEMDLAIDGDLFKVTLLFQAAEAAD